MRSYIIPKCGNADNTVLGMAELSLKQQFVRSLRGMLRNSGMTRGELIAHLGISASAMSQMLKGELLPTASRLDKIIEFLHPPVDEAEKLQDMVLWLRSGSGRRRSEFNRRLFMARCQSSLTLEQLSAAAAIPVARLRRLEDTAYAVPTPDEVETLSMVLGLPLEKGMFAVGRANDAAAPLEVAESVNMALPRITADVLNSYSARKDFLKFVEANAFGFWAFHLLPAEAVAVVSAPAARFGVSLPGVLELVLGSRRPEGFVRLDLCKESRGGLFMDGDGGFYGGWLLTERCSSRKAAWRLPVLQVNHIPDGAVGKTPGRDVPPPRHDNKTASAAPGAEVKK